MLRIAVVALLTFKAVSAQPPRAYFPWWNQPVVKDLNLTGTQQQKIRATVHEFRDKLIEERAAVQKAELDLQDVFDDDAIDMRRAIVTVENLAQARENLTRTFAEMALRLRMVLTKDQWRQLQKRRQEDIRSQKPERNPGARP